MKNKRLLGLSAAFALTLAIGVTSCKKDKDDNGSSAGMSATIGTNAFKPKLVGASLENKYVEVFGGQTLPGDSVYVTVDFADTVALNTKLPVKGLQVATFTTDKIYSGYSTGSHGSITVTTFDKTNKRVAGKFEGVLYSAFTSGDSITVKDGQFNTTYISF
ncbi:hypothetical protein A4H97_00215 [Niastella yeongjuensis]|uniref:Lipoprotein n=1 Tax=Niastella yeongjuensis TaxID=354355 RepID=A0A1V9EVX8_9BACT|nr:hypothetical protein [Niastella yeongjuensis]OQP50308.1 hypothetical protein A4H97_00215 [Niastella yeongjuensis]SEN40261.1 hypothetical protein SAMN05660816_00908 [Niastella yeongjuensis]